MRMQINYQLHTQQHILWVCTLAGETMFCKYELPVLTGLSEVQRGNTETHQCPKLKARCRSF